MYNQGSITKIGTYHELNALAVKSNFNKENWRFNDPLGEIGIVCCDNT